ncbi:hypothetical protein BpOF4_05685 [Alkalihalophilus pseudofirmus OF4]|uniref:Uncharacterized protein n=1 Tax=Alkalihalophilus pseudofirmus (strain ATCC BAA-2126 / JCM 17055 / OF4) TaxID=398511 RepID=D3FZF7_ALKPO|nr:hypothetical protein [Alkalihalophilus pseudofirmus]ADC49199.1 hypothetical protein BpOF4_05685 [Alkalihalophilus pseudofirmus OF4]
MLGDSINAPVWISKSSSCFGKGISVRSRRLPVINVSKSVDKWDHLEGLVKFGDNDKKKSMKQRVLLHALFILAG